MKIIFVSLFPQLCSYGALNSINFLEGLAKGPQWPHYASLTHMEDFESYLKRLTAVPQQVIITRNRQHLQSNIS